MLFIHFPPGWCERERKKKRETRASDSSPGLDELSREEGKRKKGRIRRNVRGLRNLHELLRNLTGRRRGGEERKIAVPEGILQRWFLRTLIPIGSARPDQESDAKAKKKRNNVITFGASGGASLAVHYPQAPFLPYRHGDVQKRRAFCIARFSTALLLTLHLGRCAQKRAENGNGAATVRIREALLSDKPDERRKEKKKISGIGSCARSRCWSHRVRRGYRR